MNRKIELGLGDIRIEADDRHIYIIKTAEGTPGKILLMYNLNDDNKTCTQNVLPAFEEENKLSPFTIIMTDVVGNKYKYTKNILLPIIDNLDLSKPLKNYFKKLVVEDFGYLESCYGEDTRVYYYDDEIAQCLGSEESSEE